MSTGIWDRTIDSVPDATSGALATDPASPSAVPLFVGANGAGSFPLDGDVYGAEVRDGIDGPIVAVFDPDDIVI